MAVTKAGYLLVKTRKGRPTTDVYPLASGTYYRGSVVRCSPTSGSAKLYASGTTGILGVMAEDVTTAQSTSGKYRVYLADDNNIFEAVMIASSTPQQKQSDFTDIAVASTHNYRVSSTNTNNILRIVGFDSNESLSAHASAKYHVQFHKSIFGQTKVSNAA